MSDGDPDGSVWQREATGGRPAAPGAQQAGDAGDREEAPGKMLQWLAGLTTTLLREGPPLVARELHALSAAEGEACARLHLSSTPAARRLHPTQARPARR